MTSSEVQIIIASMFVIAALAFMAGYLEGKRTYECKQVGSGLSHFKTDKTVYRICR